MKFVKRDSAIDIIGKDELKKYRKDENGNYVLPKNQKYFGMFVQRIDGVVPYAFNSYDEKDKDELCYDYNYNLVEFIAEKPIPLVFRIVDEDYAEEIISCKLIKIGDSKDNYDSISNEDLSIEEFQSKFDKFKNNPLVIDTDGYYPVIGNFKMIYADYYRGREEEFRKLMDEIENKAKENFNKKLEEMICDAEDMAYTDNMIYDYKKRLK